MASSRTIADETHPLPSKGCLYCRILFYALPSNELFTNNLSPWERVIESLPSSGSIRHSTLRHSPGRTGEYNDKSTGKADPLAISEQCITEMQFRRYIGSL
jgi:hypothetical protein